MTTHEEIIVFTDGACKNNGYHNAKAGIGIHFPNNELQDVSRIIQKNPTNQRAELYAILVALYYIDKKLGLENKKIIIKTDSLYSINCITKWIKAWKKNDWVKKDGEKVKHKEIITRIDAYMQKYDIEFEHVPAHTNKTDSDSVGNRVADELATSAWSNHNAKNNLVEQEQQVIKIPKKPRVKKASVKKKPVKTATKTRRNGDPSSSGESDQIPKTKITKKKTSRSKKDVDFLDYDPDTVEIKTV